MLHITNGDSIACSLMNSALPGRKLAFREDLTSGPTPSGLSTSDWLRLRAEFLKPADSSCLQGLTEQQAALDSSARDQETVLWFGHDLNCQVHLIYVLTRQAAPRSRPDPLSLVCIGEFPGINPFICLGQLTSENLESLFPGRHQVSEIELELAARGWSAYCSSDPTHVEALLDSDTAALPFLAAALRLHLARFPSRRNGLGLIENWALRQLSSRSERFARLFARFVAEHPRYGIGDSQFWEMLERMSASAEPLTRITGVQPGATFESVDKDKIGIEITLIGRQVLEAQKDFIELNGIDLWMGGVHIQAGSNEWRLDDDTGKLVKIRA